MNPLDRTYFVIARDPGTILIHEVELLNSYLGGSPVASACHYSSDATEKIVTPPLPSYLTFYSATQASYFLSQMLKSLRSDLGFANLMFEMENNKGLERLLDEESHLLKLSRKEKTKYEPQVEFFKECQVYRVNASGPLDKRVITLTLIPKDVESEA